MCGIVGFINCGSHSEIKNAVHSILHRGPDGSNTKWFAYQNSGLGHTRLAIIDLSERGNQPMYDYNSGNWIVLNGEIYNHKEIRIILEKDGYKFNSDSDTEVVLHSFHKWKEDCLKYFNGMFAFAIYNEISGDTFIARDRLGIKPLYYFQGENSLAFASEIKALLKLNSYSPEPDMYAIQTPVHYQITPFTGFKNILKLNAGHYGKFNNGKFEITKYWDITVSEEKKNENELIEELDILINDAVRLNLVSDAKVGAMLSGGLDSSILSVLMQNKMSQPLYSYTIKFDKKDLKLQGNTDDSFFAKNLANKFGFNHQEILIQPNVAELLPKMIYHLDEPIADPSSINTYLISLSAKEQGIKVLLNGMGADEVFSGYRSHLACLKADVYKEFVPQAIRLMIEKVVSKIPEGNTKRNFKYVRWFKRFIEIASLEQYERQLAIKNSSLQANNFDKFFQNSQGITNSYFYKKEKMLFDSTAYSYLTKMCLCDTKIYMTDHNLTYSDKSMMAASIEGRPTLIDYRIVEFMFKLNTKMRVNGNTQKYILKKVAERYLPKDIIYRPKAPFSAPMRGWLKNELNDMVNDILSYHTVKERGIYNPEYVQRLIVNNKKGIEDNSQLIWRLMVSEIWFRTFFKK